MSAAQWFAAFMALVVGCLALTALSWRAEQHLRNIYRRLRVAWDHAELERMVAEEEAAWDEWASILAAVDNTPHDEPTPIYAETIVDNVRRGGAA